MMALKLPPDFNARVLHNEPLAKHTSWRVGGPADVFFKPQDANDLGAFLRSLAPHTPVHWIGLGSNLLVRDGGIRGVVIATLGAFTPPSDVLSALDSTLPNAATLSGRRFSR